MSIISREKRSFLKTMMQRPLDVASYPLSLAVNLHGVLTVWKVKDSSALELLRGYFPKSWQSQENRGVEIYWDQPPFSRELWESESDPNVEFLENAVAQRDFAAVERTENQVEFFAPYEMSDGVFNFLRWFLPKRLLSLDQFVLHSSAVLDSEKKKAYICLGESGAGKTTISQMAGNRSVLGDDMNIVKRKEKGWVISAGAIGQAIQEVGILGEEFEIGGFFFLKKSKENKLEPVRLSKATLAFYTGVANLFWDRLSDSEVSKVRELVTDLVGQGVFRDLQFNLDGDVWDHVERSL